MPPQPQRRPRPQPSITAIGSAVAPNMSRRVAAERWHELDAHRGIAVLAVVVFHVYQFCNVGHFLYLGTLAYTVLNSLDAMIPWLFVISAFLLFRPIAQAIVEGRAASPARGFLTRGAIRVLPLYYVAVVVVWFSRQHTLPGDWRDLLEHLTFTQVFDEKRIFYTIAPAWAISVEVFFYLGLAALGVGLSHVCRRLDNPKHRIAVLAGSIILLSMVSLAWKGWAFAAGHHLTTSSNTTWFGPLANIDTFAVGMAVAIVAAVLGEGRFIASRSRLGLRVAGVTILALAFATRHANTWTGVYFSTACAIGFGCLVAAAVLGSPKDQWSARATSNRALLWLGAISYSIYLWHEPILLALRGSIGLVHQAPGDFLPDAIAVVFASILVGTISYLLIERPTSLIGGIFGRDGRVLLAGNTK